MYKNSTILFLLLHLSLFGFTQIPNGYYNQAQGLSGEPLKEALNYIISNHTEYPYNDSDTDVWDILKESDKDPNNPDNVILFYTGWSVNADQEYNNGSGWAYLDNVLYSLIKLFFSILFAIEGFSFVSIMRYFI